MIIPKSKGWKLLEDLRITPRPSKQADILIVLLKDMQAHPGEYSQADMMGIVFVAATISSQQHCEMLRVAALNIIKFLEPQESSRLLMMILKDENDAKCHQIHEAVKTALDIIRQGENRE